MNNSLASVTQAARAGARQPEKPPRRRPRATVGRHAPWWFLLPALAFYLFVVIVPSARGAYYSLTDWNGLSRTMHFIGLSNFVNAFKDPEARGSLWQTLIMAVAITVFQNLVGLLLALGVNAKIKSRNVLRVALFAPVVMSSVVVGYLWKYLMEPAGPIDAALSAIGLGSFQPDWLGNPSLALWSIVIVVVWQYSGYSMVIFLAG